MSAEGPASGDALPDDTVRVRRAGSAPLAAPAGDLDEATLIARSRSVAGLGETQPSEPDDSGPRPGPRRRTADEAVLEPEDGSTMVVRRESRRRAALAGTAQPHPSTGAAGVPAPLGRIARTPQEAPGYGPRQAAPVRASRSESAPRAPQPPVDTAALEAGTRRRARRRVVIAVVSASVFLAAIAAALLALAANL